MPTAYRDAQVVGTGSTSTYSTLYSTGSNTAIISNILISNESAGDVIVRIGVAGTATTPASGAFLLYDILISPNDTLSFGPYSLGSNKFLRVSSSSVACSFSAAVAEIS